MKTKAIIMSSNETWKLRKERRRDELADKEKLRKEFDELKSRLSPRYSEVSFDDYVAAYELDDQYEPDDLLNYNYLPPEWRSRPASPTLLRDALIWLLKLFGAAALLLAAMLLSAELASLLALGAWGAFVLFVILWFGSCFTAIRIFRIVRG